MTSCKYYRTGFCVVFKGTLDAWLHCIIDTGHKEINIYRNFTEVNLNLIINTVTDDKSRWFVDVFQVSRDQLPLVGHDEPRLAQAPSGATPDCGLRTTSTTVESMAAVYRQFFTAFVANEAN